MDTWRTNFEPFIITQIRESQNEFLIANDELLNNKQDFSNYLYRYIDWMPPCSCLRIFRYRKRIYSAIFFLSDVKEPRSGRGGIYLILGLSCPFRIFKQCPSLLAKNLINLFEIVKNEFNVQNNEDFATTVIKKLWDTNDIYQYTRNILFEFKSQLLYNYIYRENKWIARKYSFITSNKYNTIYVLSEKDFSKHILYFTLSVSHSFELFKFNFDYTDTKGYGCKTKTILYNGDQIPNALYGARFNAFYINEEKIPFIEMCIKFLAAPQEC